MSLEIRAKIYLTGERFKTFGYFELTHSLLFPNVLIWKAIPPDPDITLILHKRFDDNYNAVHLKFMEDDFEHYS